MLEERNAYIQTVIDLGGDVEGRNRAREQMRDSDVWAYGAPVPFSYVPYLLTPSDRDKLFADMRLMHGILCKIIRRYVDDPSYRAVFGYSPEFERLILLPCGYDQQFPIGRLDFFLDEETLDYKFCEFNTDGSGAMSRAAKIAELVQDSPSFALFAQGRTVTGFELFDSWATAFMNIYRSDPIAVERPVVAVTDFEESGVHSDFVRFIAAFERAGIPARFVDVRSFEFDGEHLIDPSDGTIINAIYRRAVTSELLQHPGECDAFLQAVEARRVCLIGHFRTTVVHSKVINIVLYDQRTRDFLTPEECAYVDAHVLRTYRFEDGIDEDVRADVAARKDAWILKPVDDYGAHGVYPGVDFEQGEWEGIVAQCFGAGYIVQEFYQPPRVPLIDALVNPDDPCEVGLWGSMPGIYVYDGEPVGLYCRLGKTGVIAIDHGCLCAPGFVVDQPV